MSRRSETNTTVSIAIAAEAHTKKIDKGGAPYILHPRGMLAIPFAHSCNAAAAGSVAVPAPGAYLSLETCKNAKGIRVNWKKRQKQIEQLRAKHGKDRSLAREFPDLKVEQRPAPCTNGMRGSTARRTQPPGMKQFPVGHSHKQGLELITPGMDLQWMGGKKT
jgi:hypothetical protein